MRLLSSPERFSAPSKARVCSPKLIGMKSDVKLHMKSAFGYREMGNMRRAATDMVGCWELWPRVCSCFCTSDRECSDRGSSHS